MKNVLTILLAFFILISGMHLSIAKHICGGELADVKISISETTSSCGMEKAQTACGAHDQTTSDCCRNEITRLEVDHYFGSPSMEINKVFQPVVVLFFLPLIQSTYSVDSDNRVLAAADGNDKIPIREVSLPKICVFRI